MGVSVAGRRANLADTVFDKLKQRILTGDYAKDSLLPTQEDLAREFGVSRTVMRDAFHKLSSLGFIEIRQGKGSFVRSAQPISIVSSIPLVQDFKMEAAWIKDLMEARYYLEQSIVRLAAARICADGIAFLEQNVSRMDQAVRGGDEEGFVVQDLEFHEKLAEICGNKILKQTLGAIRGAMKNFFEGLSKIVAVPPRSLAYHRDILEAVRAKDPDAAVLVMRKHMKDVISNLKKNYDIDIRL
jgi:DNA-binding FadR family transcriptional regulator